MIQNIRRSLTDLLGAEYTAAVCRARAALTGESPEALRAVADEKVDFYPEAFARRQEELMGDIGHSLAPAFADTEDGAPTHSYRARPAQLCSSAGRAGRIPHRRGRPPVFRGQKRALPDSPGTRLSRLLAY